MAEAAIHDQARAPHGPVAETRAPHLNVDPHRKVGWLELFYDLVYVATIVQLGNKLSDDVSVEGFAAFALLFVPIWWVWMGTTFYANRFVADDLPHRLLVFAQIFVVSALAITVFDGLGSTSSGFAIAYVAARFILLIMYTRAARHVPEARALTRRYVIGFAIAALVWLVSAFVPAPLRFLLWVIGLAIDFYTPLSPGSQRLQRELPPSPHHLPERLGLFTIIVFGETFIKVIGGFVGEDEFAIETIIAALLGLGLVGGLWWTYFENVAERAVDWAKGAQAWIYLHLPLQLGLIALAVGVYKLVTAQSDILADHYRLLICGALAISLLAVGLIEQFTVKRLGEKDDQLAFRLRVGGAVIALGLGFFATGMNQIVLMALLAVVSLAQVVTDVLRRDYDPLPESDIELDHHVG